MLTRAVKTELVRRVTWPCLLRARYIIQEIEYENHRQANHLVLDLDDGCDMKPAVDEEDRGY